VSFSFGGLSNMTARRGDIRDPARRRRILKNLYRNQKGQCAICGLYPELPWDFTDGKLPLNAATIDHIKPRAAGGTNLQENLQMVCFGCNRDKGDRWED
jgi:5-methylcytosine-specific restriction endonuclease McrA